MTDLDRRSFLTGASAAALATPGLAAASEAWDRDRVVAFVGQQRARGEELATRQAAHMARAGFTSEVLALTRRVGPAIHGLNALAALPEEAQLEPEAQEAILGWFSDVGEGVVALADSLEAVPAASLRALGEDRRPLHDTLAWLDAEVPGATMDDEVRPRFGLAIDQVRWEIDHRPLDGAVEDLVSRVRRIQAIAADPERAERALRGSGRARKAPREEVERAPFPSLWHASPKAILGALLLGIGTLVGSALVVFSVPAMLCPCVGIPLLILGLAIVWGSWARGPEMIRPTLGGKDDVWTTWVPARGAWVDTGWEPDVLNGPRETIFEVVGAAHVGPDHRATGPEGTGERGGEGSLAPELPLGALVGRVGSQVFLVPEGAMVVPWEGYAKLELAVNMPFVAEVRGRANGFLVRFHH